MAGSKGRGPLGWPRHRKQKTQEQSRQVDQEKDGNDRKLSVLESKAHLLRVSGVVRPSPSSSLGGSRSQIEDSLVKINPSKLLKTQARCPGADKTIPISDTLRVQRMQCSPLPFLGCTGTC